MWGCNVQNQWGIQLRLSKTFKNKEKKTIKGKRHQTGLWSFHDAQKNVGFLSFWKHFFALYSWSNIWCFIFWHLTTGSVFYPQGLSFDHTQLCMWGLWIEVGEREWRRWRVQLSVVSQSFIHRGIRQGRSGSSHHINNTLLANTGPLILTHDECVSV